jgi:hypothetical protein
MATEKQIAANRANSKRSTGPKTDYGRLKSSRNALRHGLSRPLPFDIPVLDTIAHGLVVVGADDAHLLAARQLAHSYLEIVRIRDIRRQILASLFRSWQPANLKRLANLDRYERSAFTKHRTAGKGLSRRSGI